MSIGYDHISKGYDKLYKEEQQKKLRLIKEKLKELKIKISKDDKLLDVGCGTGISSDFECDVTGIDPSKELLNHANIKAIKGIAEDLPFEDNSFDIIVSLTAIHNFSDIEKGLKEMKRVGKNLFIFSVLRKSSKAGLIDNLIKQNFKVIVKIDEEKDHIYFLN